MNSYRDILSSLKNKPSKDSIKKAGGVSFDRATSNDTQVGNKQNKKERAGR